MSGCLRIVLPVLILIAFAIYSALPHPTHDQAVLKQVAADARRLLARYPVVEAGRQFALARDKWPATIAALKPYSVVVRSDMIDITIKPFFDGGWGYGFTTDKRNLTMSVECWSGLGQDVYWHGPC